MSNEKAFYGQKKEKNQMKKSLPLLVLAAALGIVAMGCDPAPKDEPATTSTDVKKTSPHATAPDSVAPPQAKTK